MEIRAWFAGLWDKLRRAVADCHPAWIVEPTATRAELAAVDAILAARKRLMELRNRPMAADVPIDVILNHLDVLATVGEAAERTGSVRDIDGQNARALREAINLLRAHQDLQPNKALTASELRGMVGAWVWVEVRYEHCGTSGWAMVATGTLLGYLDQMLRIEDCGAKFTAWLRPPAGEAVTRVASIPEDRAESEHE